MPVVVCNKGGEEKEEKEGEREGREIPSSTISARTRFPCRQITFGEKKENVSTKNKQKIKYEINKNIITSLNTFELNK